MSKTLVLNGVEEKTFKKEGVVQVRRNGVDYLVKKEDNGTISINSLGCNVVVVCPLDLGKNAIIITHEENRELKNTGKTTHTKAGITYNITLNENNDVVVDIKNEYTNLLMKSDC